jgi:hypothetical protein
VTAPPTASTEAAPTTDTPGANAKPGTMAAPTPLSGQGKRKEPAPSPAGRPTPARSAPTLGPTRERGTNDPLGDQK